MMQPQKLEAAIFAWISEHHPALAPHLVAIDVAEREHTGAGLYTYLSSDEDREWDRPPIDGPDIESAQLPEGAGSILWLLQGVPACLEIYANGDHFPENLEEFELS